MNKGRKENNKPKKICITCGKEQYTDQKFYLSNNEFHKNDRRFPVCKSCVSDQINYENIQSIFDILQQMNRPFLKDTWANSVVEVSKTGKDLFGVYYKNVILNYKTLGWNNSIFDKGDLSIPENNKEEDNDVRLVDPLDFKITRDMIIRWGSNYGNEDYLKLEDFYTRMKDTNRIETPQEEAYLKKLAVISLKMDKELEQGNYSQVKQLGDLFSKYMADGKFRAMDRTDADKAGGIRNFGTIYSEVEKDDHIPPWEYYRKLKGIDQDIIDKTIMHIENFTLRLNKIERMTEPPSDTPKLDSEYGDLE